MGEFVCPFDHISMREEIGEHVVLATSPVGQFKDECLMEEIVDAVTPESKPVINIKRCLRCKIKITYSVQKQENLEG